MGSIYGGFKFRHEHKYLISHGQYLQLREILQKLMQPDKHTQENGHYHIRSLYFDDLYDTAAREKTMGHINRNKYRIRIYNQKDDVIKLEIKEKRQDFIAKKSSKISREDFDNILHGNTTFLYDQTDQVKTSYYLQIRNNNLKPKVIVDYYREAYVLPYNQVRVTFDKHLSAAGMPNDIFNSKLMAKQVSLEYSFILEVKYNNFLPGFLRSVLEIYSGNRLAISKYLICRQFLEGKVRE